MNPGIILLSLSGFGHSGPEQDYVAYGPTVEQVCGLSSMLGAPGELPTGTGLFVPDIVGGTLGAGLVMAALRGRARDGVGCHLDLAESESVRWMMGHLVLDAQAGRNPELQRLGNRHRQFAPHGTFSCQEPGLWVAMAIRSDEEWARLAPELDARARDLPFRSQAGRHADQAAVEELVGSWTRGLPRDRVLARLAELAIPAAPVATVDEVFRNEHFLARPAPQSAPDPGLPQPRHLGRAVGDGRRAAGATLAGPRSRAAQRLRARRAGRPLRGRDRPARANGRDREAPGGTRPRLSPGAPRRLAPRCRSAPRLPIAPRWPRASGRVPVRPRPRSRRHSGAPLSRRD